MANVRQIYCLLLVLAIGFLQPSGGVAAEKLVGVVMTGNSPYYSEMHRAFAESLANRLGGSIQVEIIEQKPFPDPIALSNAARKLIVADVDLIVSYGSPAALAVLHEKSRIPLVYAGVYDPGSLQINGPSVTGCGYKVPLSSLLRYLKELKRIDNLTVFYSSLEEDSVRQLRELSELAIPLKITLVKIDIKGIQDIQGMNLQKSTDAAFITGSSIVSQWLGEILALLKEQNLPSAFVLPDKNENGVTIALFQGAGEQGEKAAEIAARVLLGEQAKEIAAEVLRSTELVFNLKEAKAMGMKNPMKLIVEATRVIK